MYEAHFTARAETYTRTDHRAADTDTAVLVMGVARRFTHALRRRRPSDREAVRSDPTLELM